MVFIRRFDKALIVCFFIFSCWLMWKSFGYDAKAHEFILARNVLGDFGLHLSLIRSVSWGSNIPVESPFYPGKPMPYHYLFDILVGFLERIGIRIDIALNGLSAMAFTGLLYLIYLFPQRLFKKSFFIGFTSVLLFIFHSSLSFLDFFKGKQLNLHLLRDIWTIPNYTHAGPFDGSPFSIFFTFNVYLNQRHTIVGLFMAFWILYVLIPEFIGKEKIRRSTLFILGIAFGLMGWIHSLLFFGTGIVVLFLIFSFRKFRILLPLFLPAFFIFLPHAVTILQVSRVTHAFINPGFSSAPFHWGSFLKYWWLNLGLVFLLIPLGYMISGKKQRFFFAAFFSLFLIANIFQLSNRMDHNHTLLNFFIIGANFYVANFLFWLWKRGTIQKLFVILLFVPMTTAGVLDLMAVKNDYHLRVADAPKNALMQWIRTKTAPNAIFLSQREILDPVTLSGRRNYLGHSYYLSVMGYDTESREKLVRRFFESDSSAILQEMRAQGIGYIMLPHEPIVDFPYNIHTDFWDTISPVYQDSHVSIYKL